MLHPIHYSLILNGLAIVASAVLSWKLDSPLLFVVALLLANHSLGRFQDGGGDDDDPEPSEREYGESPRMGFTAEVSGR